jgi:hypothetical protein
MDTKERLSENQHVCYRQAGTMAEERLTEFEYAAVARMDTKERLSESNMYVYGQAGTMVQERLTEIEHGAGVRLGRRVMVIRLYKVCMGEKYSKRTRYICLVKGGLGGGN